MASARAWLVVVALPAFVVAFGPAVARLPAPSSPRPRARRRRAAPSMLFLVEAPFKDDALRWAKETSRTQRHPKRCVAALYDAGGACVYVGAFDDTAVAVASLCKKHGRAAVAALRAEEFVGDDVPAALVDGLVAAWLAEATEDNGGAAPAGNEDADWPKFDATQNPFLAGYLGAEGDGLASLLTPEELAEEKLQNRREAMKGQLDDAVRAGDETLATKLLRRLARFDDGVTEDDS